MKRRKRARRPTLLRRLLEEIENFVHYYHTTMREAQAKHYKLSELLEKATTERVIQFTSPPRSRFHRKVIELINQYFVKEQANIKREVR